MITNKEVKEILRTEIPFKELKKNSGIYETNKVRGISFGVSYEDDDNGDECYIYNLFTDDEYINISETGNKCEVFNDMVINEIVDIFNGLLV